MSYPSSHRSSPSGVPPRHREFHPPPPLPMTSTHYRDDYHTASSQAQDSTSGDVSNNHSLPPYPPYPYPNDVALPNGSFAVSPSTGNVTLDSQSYAGSRPPLLAEEFEQGSNRDFSPHPSGRPHADCNCNPSCTSNELSFSPGPNTRASPFDIYRPPSRERQDRSPGQQEQQHRYAPPTHSHSSGGSPDSSRVSFGTGGTQPRRGRGEAVQLQRTAAQNAETRRYHLEPHSHSNSSSSRPASRNYDTEQQQDSRHSSSSPHQRSPQPPPQPQPSHSTHHQHYMRHSPQQQHNALDARPPSQQQHQHPTHRGQEPHRYPQQHGDRSTLPVSATNQRASLGPPPGPLARAYSAPTSLHVQETPPFPLWVNQPTSTSSRREGTSSGGRERSDPSTSSAKKIHKKSSSTLGGMLRVAARTFSTESPTPPPQTSPQPVPYEVSTIRWSPEHRMLVGQITVKGELIDVLLPNQAVPFALMPWQGAGHAERGLAPVSGTSGRFLQDGHWDMVREVCEFEGIRVVDRQDCPQY
ncbi:hypothetical protein DFP72DRAFT_862939 [Ephemerocybe angulata]|uniref:Uncharacterized protein n=1 Tax=Ephemerocybe angulata TaxID=980116 RepID=A0A8H6LUC4_9AGAR|nr:hypothetical protein DFP72DRAFT_862939 [Tulosesus angulatus]